MLLIIYQKQKHLTFDDFSKLDMWLSLSY